eukprot:TRINITY_DN53961_c0_g1_i1.p1 TRINITY_DN53961_c0_g1~~TRINITY_DN53961_c0_g1_i1.p1  ORF type:complete len:605 (+),score=115.01 TRINITY_DN53961_c0_g1_i1:47-1861(+)
MAGAAPLTEADLSSPLYCQEHLFVGVSEDEKKSRLSQLNFIDSRLPGGGLKGYLDRARVLLKDTQAGKNPFSGFTPEVPMGQKLVGETGPGSEIYASMERLGMSQLAKCAFCLVAGGLGERLGYPGIKIGITSEVTTGISFIELYCKFILSFQAYARKTTGNHRLVLPLAIMTSGDTHAKTEELMKKHRYFGLSAAQVFLLKQEKVPALIDINARISAKGGDIETKPHGHGDIHGLLHQQGLAKRWASEGREWLFVFQDTNPLSFRSLCAVLGVSAKNDFVMNSLAIPRIPGESIGGICKLVNRSAGKELTVNVEYNQLDPLLKETPVGGDVADASGFSPYPGNINVLVFKIPEYAQCIERTGGIVPEFVNPKWADKSKTSFKSATRLECMMQDFPHLCGAKYKVGLTQLERDMCKTSVKNNLADAAKKNPPECALSAEADIYACNARLLRLAAPDVVIEEPSRVSFLGVSANLGARIVLDPSFAVSLEELKQRVRGPIRISKRSTLILEGAATLDGLDLDGALHVRGPVSATAAATAAATPRGLSVRNAGLPLVAIPEADLAAQPPSLQIRGYTQGRGEVRVLNVGGRGGLRDVLARLLPCGA